MSENTAPVSRLEARWVSALTAVALFFGGWWLQNQYETVLRLQQQLTDFMRFVDDKYVEKDYLRTVTDRLDRIDRKVDKILDAQPERPSGPAR